jgi:Uma2 family endonuclease
MTPATVRHGEYSGQIIEWLVKIKRSGRIFVECGIQTSGDVKVADVAWGSAEFIKRNEGDVPWLMESPEIVVELKSPSNTSEEIERKNCTWKKAQKRFGFVTKKGACIFLVPKGN